MSSGNITGGLEPWRRGCIIAAVSILILITTVGNALIIIALCVEKKIRTIPNYFYLNIAVADLLIGVFVMPLTLIDIIHDDWPLGTVTCDLLWMFDFLLASTAFLGVTGVSVDRYLAVCRPVQHMTSRHRKCVIAIVLTWVVLSLVWIPPRLIWNNSESNICDQTIPAFYLVPAIVCANHVPTVVAVTMNVLIYRKIMAKFGKLRLNSRVTDTSHSHEVPTCSVDDPIESICTTHTERKHRNDTLHHGVEFRANRCWYCLGTNPGQCDDSSNGEGKVGMDGIYTLHNSLDESGHCSNSQPPGPSAMTDNLCSHDDLGMIPNLHKSSLGLLSTKTVTYKLDCNITDSCNASGFTVSKFAESNTALQLPLAKNKNPAYSNISSIEKMSALPGTSKAQKSAPSDNSTISMNTASTVSLYSSTSSYNNAIFATANKGMSMPGPVSLGPRDTVISSNIGPGNAFESTNAHGTKGKSACNPTNVPVLSKLMPGSRCDGVSSASDHNIMISVDCTGKNNECVGPAENSPNPIINSIGKHLRKRWKTRVEGFTHEKGCGDSLTSLRTLGSKRPLSAVPEIESEDNAQLQKNDGSDINEHQVNACTTSEIQGESASPTGFQLDMHPYGFASRCVVTQCPGQNLASEVPTEDKDTISLIGRKGNTTAMWYRESDHKAAFSFCQEVDDRSLSLPEDERERIHDPSQIQAVQPRENSDKTILSLCKDHGNRCASLKLEDDGPDCRNTENRPTTSSCKGDKECPNVQRNERVRLQDSYIEPVWHRPNNGRTTLSFYKGEDDSHTDKNGVESVINRTRFQDHKIGGESVTNRTRFQDLKLGCESVTDRTRVHDVKLGGESVIGKTRVHDLKLGGESVTDRTKVQDHELGGESVTDRTTGA